MLEVGGIELRTTGLYAGISGVWHSRFATGVAQRVMNDSFIRASGAKPPWTASYPFALVLKRAKRGTISTMRDHVQSHEQPSSRLFTASLKAGFETNASNPFYPKVFPLKHTTYQETDSHFSCRIAFRTVVGARNLLDPVSGATRNPDPGHGPATPTGGNLHSYRSLWVSAPVALAAAKKA